MAAIPCGIGFKVAQRACFVLRRRLGDDVVVGQIPLISNILLGCAAFSSIITLERADYNLFLFLFVAYSMFWKSEDIKPNQRIINIERMLFTLTLTVSLLVDLIWIFTHHELSSSFIILFSWIEFFIKILVIGVVFVMWQGYRRERTMADIEGTGFRGLEEEEQ